MGSKANLTIRDVNARVDKLTELFQNGLQEFKNEFLVSKSDIPSASGSDENSAFLNKFKAFEVSMIEELGRIKDDVAKLNEQITSLNKSKSNYELKRNYNFIIVHGLKENKTDIYEELLNLFSDKMGVNVKKSDINQCYRFGKSDTKKDKPRPVAVQFCQRWLRDSIFFNKKKLKGSRVMVTEMLTFDNLNLFKKCRELMGTSAWTFNGLIYVSSSDGRKLIKSEADLPDIVVRSTT